MGLSSRELVALAHFIGGTRKNYKGAFRDSWRDNNGYFASLLSETWEPMEYNGRVQYKAAGKEVYMLQTDVNLLLDAELKTIVQEYASDEAAFLAVFMSAWTKLMNADRFDGPVNSVCASNVDTTSEKKKGLSTGAIAGIAIGCIALVGAMVYIGSSSAGSSRMEKENNELRMSLAMDQENNRL
jgi:hypothetical protein